MGFGRLILASASARRKSLLQRLGIPFEVYPSSLEEPSPEVGEDPALFTKRAALFKAQEVAKAIDDEDAWILSADTIVVLNKEILGKPKSAEDAKRMLHDLSGKSHLVYTGYTVLQKSKEVEFQEAVKTEVWFRYLKSHVIDHYIASGEPMDKAGSYGIQDRGGIFVDYIHGCYNNVVGLPLGHVIAALERLGAGSLFEEE